MIKWLGLDFHVILTLLQRGWAVVAGAVMICFVPSWFDNIEQGYYYTFSSLLAMQIFFELGFNYVVVQLVGHEKAHVNLLPNGKFEGDDYHIGRLASLISLLKRWYRVVSIAFFVIVSAIGIVFFRRANALDIRLWLGAWLLLVLCTSINLYFSPFLAAMEGCGNIGNVARVRLTQSIAGYTSMWLALTFHAGLWAISIVPGAAAVCTALWLHFRGTILHALAATNQTNAVHKVSWLTEIFPFQWRIAVSWISGYLIFYLFTPLVFANQGAVEAGRVGLALAVFNTLLMLGTSWVSAKTPTLVRHIARNEKAHLNQVFASVTLRAVSATAIASFCFLALIHELRIFDVPIVSRISDLPVLMLLAIVTIANTFIYAAAAYMRAHKEEPMLYESLSVGVLTLIAVYFGSRQSVLFTMTLYAAITFIVALPWTTWLFLTYFRRTA